MVTNRHTSAEMRKLYSPYVSIDLLPSQYIPKGYKFTSIEDGDPEVTEKLRPLLTDPYVVPLMAEDLSNMPTAYIVTTESDPLRDEGIMYGQRLKKAGVSSTLAHYYDGFHSMLTMFDGLLTFEVGKRSYNDLLKFMKENL